MRRRADQLHTHLPPLLLLQIRITRMSSYTPSRISLIPPLVLNVGNYHDSWLHCELFKPVQTRRGTCLLLSLSFKPLPRVLLIHPPLSTPSSSSLYLFCLLLLPSICVSERNMISVTLSFFGLGTKWRPSRRVCTTGTSLINFLPVIVIIGTRRKIM